MKQENKLKLALELIWWVFTAIAVYAVLYPIHKAIHVWPFETWNIIFVVTLLTLARYTFLLKHTFLARNQIAKGVLIFVMFPLTFTLISQLNGFVNYIVEQTWDTLTGHLPGKQKISTETYIWNEMLFFGMGSVIAAPVFAVRLFMSIWRQHNRGTV